jgi:hypothetical protein
VVLGLEPRLELARPAVVLAAVAKKDRGHTLLPEQRTGGCRMPCLPRRGKAGPLRPRTARGEEISAIEEDPKPWACRVWATRLTAAWPTRL